MIDAKPLDAPQALLVDKKPPVIRKRKMESEKTEAKPKRQKRDDFVMNDQNRVVCLQCLKSYADRKSFRRHYLLYVHCTRQFVPIEIFVMEFFLIFSHTESSLPCPKCGKLFSTNAHLKRHVTMHDSDDKKNFECYICRLKTREFSGLRVHLGKEHKLETFTGKCQKCDKEFTVKSRYERHMAMVSGNLVHELRSLVE